MEFTLTIKAASMTELLAQLQSLNPSAGPPLASGAMTLAALPPIPHTPPAGNGDADEGAANPNAPALDSTGLPWDGRIHASTKVLTETGTWRKRRGVDATMAATIEAQLRAALANRPQHPAPMFDAGMPPAPQTPPPPAAAIPPAPQQQPMFQHPDGQFYPYPPVAQQQPAPQMQQPPAQPPAGPTTTAIMDFPTFMATISTFLHDGKMQVNELQGMIADAKVATIMEINTPAMINRAIEVLRSWGKPI